jgi:hypothetical protein
MKCWASLRPFSDDLRPGPSEFGPLVKSLRLERDLTPSKSTIDISNDITLYL